ncbi:MAG: ParB N-terminal domain-containing protein [Caldiserica bacterium]|jgi:hypothetical protein|nr:ParB N-terminal domain-containing protein [Caldisericota bacterium]MDH7562428.1 ParB N-terminal domain-containing protein [Caldisericota bacterium]
MDRMVKFHRNQTRIEEMVLPAPFALVHFSALKEHEMVDPVHLDELSREIKRDGFLFFPVMVDRSSLVILDGHHRVSALIDLGCQLIPSFLVDYQDESIQVSSWRPEIPVEKESVILRGLSGKPFPPKTSRHIWPWPIPRCPFPLGFLKIDMEIPSSFGNFR